MLQRQHAGMQEKWSIRFNKCKMEQMLQDEGKFGLEKLFVIL